MTHGTLLSLMAKNNLEPMPDEKPESDGSSDLGTILKHLPSASKGDSSSADLGVYRMLMNDPPVKMDEEQAGFVRGAGTENESCGDCIHYYIGKVADRKVCEIFRPSDESNIEPSDRCKFFSTDSETFPLLKGSPKKGPDKQ